MQIFTQDDIRRVRRSYINSLQFDNGYANCLIVENVGLPQGWSKSQTDLMLVKDETVLKVFIDGDISTAPPNVDNHLKQYSSNGWLELTVELNNQTDALEMLEYLKQNYNFQLEENMNPEPEESAASDTIQQGSIVPEFSALVLIQNGNSIITRCRYSGPAALIRLEIFNMQNVLIRDFPIRELSQGMIEESWDGTDNNGRQAAKGIYILKIRTAQPEGEFFRIELVHKNF